MKQIKLGNLRLGARGGVKNQPCTTNLIFWESNLDFANNRMLDKSGLNNHAALSASNCIKCNGITSLVTITLPDNLKYYVDFFDIFHSINGASRLEYNTGDPLVSGLYYFNQTTGEIFLGYDGTNHYTGWLESLYVRHTTGQEVLTFLFTSGSNTIENNVAVEYGTINKLFPFDIIEEVDLNTYLEL